MLTVYFENSRGEKRTIGIADKKETAWKIIFDFLAEHEYKTYYQRVNKFNDDIEKIDVGSHTEFFWFVPENQKHKFEEEEF